jgi:hypothetical protein
MNINRDNYEPIFLDYIEGKLTSSEKEELMEFLLENPDLQSELSQFEVVELVPEEVSFSHKETLKKTTSFINEENFDDYCIAELENDLDFYTSKKFKDYLTSHPDRNKDFELYLKTKLRADKSIVFFNKHLLKKDISKAKTYSLYKFIGAAAASAAIVVLAYNYNGNNANQNHQMAIIKNSQTTNAISSIIAQKPVNVIKTKNAKGKNIETRIIEKQLPTLASNNENDSAKNIQILEKLETIDAKEMIAAELAYSTIPEIKIPSEHNNVKQVPTENDPNWKEFALREINERIKIDELNEITNTRNLISYANSAIHFINRLVREEVQYEKEIDKVNNRTTYAFNSRILGFYSSREKK